MFKHYSSFFTSFKANRLVFEGMTSGPDARSNDAAESIIKAVNTPDAKTKANQEARVAIDKSEQKVSELLATTNPQLKGLIGQLDKVLKDSKALNNRIKDGDVNRTLAANTAGNLNGILQRIAKKEAEVTSPYDDAPVAPKKSAPVQKDKGPVIRPNTDAVAKGPMGPIDLKYDGGELSPLEMTSIQKAIGRAEVKAAEGADVFPFRHEVLGAAYEVNKLTQSPTPTYEIKKVA